MILEGRGLARDEPRIHLEDVTHVRSDLSDAPTPDRLPGWIADISKLIREPARCVFKGAQSPGSVGDGYGHGPIVLGRRAEVKRGP